MTANTLLGLVLGAGVAGGIVLAIAAWNGWTPSKAGPSTGRRDVLAARWDQETRARLAWAGAAALIVAVTTRWPIAVIGAAAWVWLWPTMFGAAKASAAQLDRLEGVATWAESLRDTIAGAVGLEQAISHSLAAAPETVRAPLQRLVGRVDAHVPLPVALSSFAEEFDDASVDLVTAALILNSRLRGRGLVENLTALADSAREELEMRRKVEERRKVLRRAAAIIIGVTVTLAGGLTLFSRTYVEPYSTPLGQLVLAVVLAVFGAALVWMRKASTGSVPERLLGSADHLGAVPSAGGRR